MSQIISLAQIDHAPHVKDVDLGSRLGLSQPLNIRQTIEKNREELEAFGPIHAAREKVDIGSGAGREITVYYLTEEQALTLCQLSRAPRAKEVRRMLVRAFIEWRNAQAQPPALALPQTYAQALRALADESEAHEETRQELALVQAKAGARPDKFSALAYSKKIGVCVGLNKLQQLGKRAKRIAQTRGIEPDTVPDERWQLVHIFDVCDLEAAWRELGLPDQPVALVEAV